MQVANTQHVATLGYEGERPITLSWDDRDWDVLDTPTRIGFSGEVAYSPLITHPPESWVGWRFIARAGDDSASYVFDVRETTPNHCQVLRVYE